MNIDLIMKLAGIGILVTVVYTVLDRLDRREYAQLVVLAGVAIGFFMVVQAVVNLFNTVRSMFQL